MTVRLTRLAGLGLVAILALSVGTGVPSRPTAAAPISAEKAVADVAAPVVLVARQGGGPRLRGFGGPRVRGFVGGPRIVRGAPRIVRAGPRVVHAGPRRIHAGPRRFYAGPRTYAVQRVHRPHRRVYRAYRPRIHVPVVPYYTYRTYTNRSVPIRNYRSCYLPCRDDGFSRRYCRRYCWSHRYW